MPRGLLFRSLRCNGSWNSLSCSDLTWKYPGISLGCGAGKLKLRTHIAYLRCRPSASFVYTGRPLCIKGLRCRRLRGPSHFCTLRWGNKNLRRDYGNPYIIRATRDNRVTHNTPSENHAYIQSLVDLTLLAFRSIEQYALCIAVCRYSRDDRHGVCTTTAHKLIWYKY